MDSKAASLLLGTDMEGFEVVEDSDDCSSDSEEPSIEENSLGSSKSGNGRQLFPVEETNNPENDGELNYHKMTEIDDREYQRELLEMAKERNIIICLPTGSGKTFIALKLTEYMLPTAIENKQKIVFLANNVPLVHQQAKYFSSNLVNTTLQDDKYVRALSGDLNIDIWKQEQWEEVLNTYHILVMSTQILVDAITKAYIKWNQICLLILDECHHAQKNHPMAELMKNYGERLEKGNKDLPKVLGLTATIIKGKSRAENIPKEIKEIETLLCCKAVTHKNYEDVLKHSTDTTLKPVRFVMNYQTNDKVCEDVNGLIEFLDKLPKDLIPKDKMSELECINHPSLVSEDQIFNKHKPVQKTLKSFLTDMLRTYAELGPYCGKMAAVIKMIFISQWIQEIEFSDDDNSSSSEEEMIDINDDDPDEGLPVILLLRKVLTTIVCYMHNLDKLMERSAAEAKKTGKDAEAYQVRYLVSDKIQKLWEILKKKKPIDTDEEEDKLCGLVFCERRITAHVLRWYLEMAAELWPDELGFLKTEVIVGHSTVVNNTEEARFTAKRQTSIIRKFHAKELNLMIATQVVEEGLNVPSCNLVVRFDSITSYPSFVQSLGRARRRGAESYALIDSSLTDQEVEKLRSFVNYNKTLAAALQENALHVGETDDDDEKVVTIDIPIPPFRPQGDEGPEITATDSISLIHRYCGALACDKIAVLTPYSWWKCHKDKNGGTSGFTAYVQLPTLSPVKDTVQGPFMPDKTLAKRAAYMETCKQLYYCGELTENLLPKPRSIDDYRCGFLDRLYEQCQEEKATCSNKIGSRNRVQWYLKKKTAEMESQIVAGKLVSLYKIKIKLEEYVGDPKTRELYEFRKYSQYYGILTNVKLDGLPSFPLHANYGTYRVTIKRVKVNGNNELVLPEVQRQLLRSFQVFLRDSVFTVKHPLLRLDAQSAFFVAPISKEGPKQHDINWDLISRVLEIDDDALVNPPDDAVRQERMFSESTYENALMVPWYKDDKSEAEFLCAIKILSDSSALTPFDEPQKFSSFGDYFGKKYGVQLYHSKDPLIYCKDVGKQLNFLTKKVDAKILRKDIQRSLLKMIPELTNVHSLPASLYIQGRLLPSVLHRVTRLLIANELRLAVASHSDFNWDVTPTNKVDLDASYVSSTPSDEEDIPDDDDDDGDQNGDTSASGPDSLGIVDTSIDDPKEKQRSPKKRKFLNLDIINPFAVSWELIAQSAPRGRKSVRDTKYALPGPPTQKSKVFEDLIEIDDYNFPSFDAETDFDKEKGPDILTIMEALTLSNAQDHISLEKLEVMGDSVLKLIVSLHIFRSFPSWDEGKLTLMRTKLISNLHLYQLGTRRDIGTILSGSFFIPQQNWVPWGFSVPKNVENFIVSKDFNIAYDAFLLLPVSNIESMSAEEIEKMCSTQVNDQRKAHVNLTHSQINDKSVADAMEAILGAYYTNGGIDSAFRIMDYLGLRGPTIDGTSVLYSRESIQSPMEFNDPRRTAKPNLISMLPDLEEILKYKFKDPWLAVEALTHPSFVTNRITPPYERLEFVGDAILDFLVTDYIIKQTNITDPGKVTDLRAALVNNVTFGSLAVRYGFHTFMKHYSKLLGDFISKFVEYQTENNHEVSNPFKLYSDFDCPTVQEIEVPKVLGDIFESIAGAIFVDSGMSIDSVWKVYYRLMKPELEKFSKDIPKTPLRELYENFPQKIKFRKIVNDTNPKKAKANASMRYQMVALQVPLNDTTKTVVGVGSTVKEAKQAAAKYVMRKIRHPEEEKLNCIPGSRFQVGTQGCNSYMYRTA